MPSSIFFAAAANSAGKFNSATGGTITTYSSGGNVYKVHTFLSAGTFTVINNIYTFDYLVVAAGQNGGDDYNQYGGAGGGWSYGNVALNGALAVTVGTVGSGSAAYGGSSSLSIYTASSGAGAGGGAPYGNPDPGTGSPGGTGLSNTIRIGTAEYYGSGGGGGGGIGGNQGAAGPGTYGLGGQGSNWSSSPYNFTNGSQGIVVIRYRIG